MPEALGQNGTRESDLSRQIGNRPGSSGIAMHQRERLADFRITSAGQPASLLRTQFRHITPERFDKEYFRELRQHGLSTRARTTGLPDRKTNGILQPLPRGAVSNIDSKHGWKSCQKPP